MNAEIKKQLEILAYKKTVPFCYGCYKKAPSGRCETCFSDDLMREMPGVGCEYGVDWVIKEILRENLTEIDPNQEFEQSIEDCYPDTIQVGWMTLNAVSVMKEMDPISWRMAKDEWIDAEVSEENIITFDETSYYRRSDLELFLSDEGLEIVSI